MNTNHRSKRLLSLLLALCMMLGQLLSQCPVHTRPDRHIPLPLHG